MIELNVSDGRLEEFHTWQHAQEDRRPGDVQLCKGEAVVVSFLSPGQD
jgi:hypothetical protein